MNKILLASLLFLAALTPVRANIFSVRAPAAFAGRTLTVTTSGGATVTTSSFGLVETWSGQAYEGRAVARVDLNGDENPEEVWTFDIPGWTAQVSAAAATQEAWMTGGGNSENDPPLDVSFHPTSNPAVQDFLIPDDRAGHALGLVQPGVGGGAAVITPVSVDYSVSGARSDWSAYSYQHASGTFDPTKAFWLVDFTTHEKGPTNQTHLGLAPWSADDTVYPLVSVTFYFDQMNWGYSFTLHGQMPGQPEMLQSLTAWPMGMSGMQTMGYGGAVDVTGSVGFTGSVAVGSYYWITRDADGWDSHYDSASIEGRPPYMSGYFLNPFAARPDPLQWSFIGATPPPPEILTQMEFYVPSGMTGGYVHQAAADRVLSEYVVRSDVWVDYDENANPHNFSYDVRTADVNLLQPYWLEINGTEVTMNERWYFNGWSSIGGPSEPPVETALFTITLPAERFNHTLYLFLQSDANNGSNLSPGEGWGGGSSWSDTVWLWDPWHQQNVGVDYPVHSVTLGPSPVGQWWTLTDLNTNESVGFSTINSGGTTADFRTWFLPAEPSALQISLSRWGHDLRVRQPNGEEHSITSGQSQGDLVLTNTGSWYSSYYYFDASGHRRPAFDFWVQDVTTGEEAAWNQSDLTSWIYLLLTTDVLASQQAQNIVSVTWHLAALTQNELLGGGFQIEREVDGSGSWQQVAMVAASDALVTGTTNSFRYLDSETEPGHSYRYRVAHYYGAQGRDPAITGSSVTTLGSSLQGYQYDAIGRLILVTQPEGAVIQIAPDANGNILNISSSN